MIFIIPLILGLGKVIEGIIHVADEVVIGQAHPTMHEVVRHRKQVFDRPVTLPAPLCEMVGIDHLADEREDELGTMIFFVSFTDEETSMFDRLLRKCASEARTRDDYFSLVRLVNTGKQRFKYVSDKMNEGGWGGKK